MKILYVTKELHQKENDGGLIVSRQNYEMLITMYGNQNIDLFEIEKPSMRRKCLNLLFFQSYGLSFKKYSEFKCLIQKNVYDFIFFNGSLYGSLVKYVSGQNFKSIVFFHNVEKLYYRDKYENDRSFFSYCFLKYVEKMETESCISSSYRIVLNERDKNDLKFNYSIDADYVLPITMKTIPLELLRSNARKEERFCLFVGSDFFANQQGLSWFIDNVVPYINIRLKVVGSISYFLEKKYKGIKNIDFVGYVDNLAEYYINSSFIVSPIFLGSGMKTKTVEALSYGKSIIGTDEAFVGIKTDFNQIGNLCNSADHFINVINTFDRDGFNIFSYNYFVEHLSFEKNCQLLKQKIDFDWR